MHKKTAASTDILEQMDLIDIKLILKVWNTFKAADYTYFSSAYGPFLKIDHILYHRTSFYQIKIKIMLVIFSDYNGVKQKIDYKQKT